MTEFDEYAAYESLALDTDDHRWAFGTGFADPLAGVDGERHAVERADVAEFLAQILDLDDGLWH